MAPPTACRPRHARRLHRAHRCRVPARRHGIGQVAFHDKADGSLVEVDGEVVGSSLIGQPFTAPEYFHPAPVGGRRRLRRVGQLGVEPRPDQPGLPGHHRGTVAAYRDENGLADDARCRSTPSPPRVRSRSAHLRRQRRAAGAACRRGARLDLDACWSSSTTHTRAAASASSASRASTCSSSTSPSTHRRRRGRSTTS